MGKPSKRIGEACLKDILEELRRYRMLIPELQALAECKRQLAQQRTILNSAKDVLENYDEVSAKYLIEAIEKWNV